MKYNQREKEEKQTNMEDQPGPQIIQKHNPTYRTEPKEDQKFDPAAVKSVVDAIFLEQIEKKNLVIKHTMSLLKTV